MTIVMTMTMTMTMTMAMAMAMAMANQRLIQLQKSLLLFWLNSFFLGSFVNLRSLRGIRHILIGCV